MHYYDNKNTTFMMIHRSGGSTVKKIIPKIHELCDAAAAHQRHQQEQPRRIEAESSIAVEAVPPPAAAAAAPVEECYLLA